MERVETIFTCVGMRLVSKGIEVKFLHGEDQVVVLVVPETSQIALGHRYALTMKRIKEAEA